MKVQLFIPCFVDQLYPQTAFNMVKVLEKACCDVEYNTNQTCCGQPAYNAGFWDDAKKVAEKFIKDFSEPVKKALQAQGLEADVFGRPKSIHSIWNKMKKKSIPFEEVYDLFAIRLILDSAPDQEKSDSWKANIARDSSCSIADYFHSTLPGIQVCSRSVSKFNYHTLCIDCLQLRLLRDPMHRGWLCLRPLAACCLRFPWAARPLAIASLR